MKMPKYGIDVAMLDERESNRAMSNDGTPKMRLESTKRAIKSANQKLH